MKYLFVLPILATLAAPAEAQEIFGGIYVHDVDTGLTASGVEGGADVQLGWRGGRIEALRFLGAPRPHIYGSLHTAGGTHFAVAGMSWTIGRTVYLRPGIGLAIHSGSAADYERTADIDFGSRILFAPEAGIGIRLSPDATIEASWVHLSHAQLFGRQNPGLDSFGLRLNYSLR